jgi:hypothetical protein
MSCDENNDFESALGLEHGNLTVRRNGGWVYADDGTKISPGAKACPNCKRYPYYCHACKDYHDACLGHIEGAKNACCGHGVNGHAYIEWETPREL